MIITIDGPAGTGKTTVAKTLAQDIGFTFFDTGAMYRAITYGFLRDSIDLDDKEAIERFLHENPVTITSRFGEKHVMLASEDVTDKIRTKKITDYVSRVSMIEEVRNTLVKTQRDLAKNVNAVFEGRDMGTVVFPDAEVKIFLTATAEERAERRLQELKKKYPDTTQELTHDNILQEINRRDALDEGRELSPLKAADDAVIIDTSELSIDQVVNRIINAKERVESKSLN